MKRNIKKALAFTCALIQEFLLFSISLAAYSTDDAEGSNVASASSDYSWQLIIWQTTKTAGNPAVFYIAWGKIDLFKIKYK